MRSRSGARRRPGLGTRLRYRFDNALSRGPLVVIAYLAFLTVAFVVVAGLVALALNLRFAEGDEGFPELAYQALLRMLDPGTFADDSSASLRTLTLIVTLLGVVLGGSLIGLIASDVDQRVDRLQRGRGRVVETGHALVLGWSSLVPLIVSELVKANESQGRACIVVLAKDDKTEVEAALRAAVRTRRNTRIVVRTGDPASPADLERVCAGQAKSIIAVRDDDGDAGVIKAVLAVRAIDPQYAGCHIVAEMDDFDDARTLRTVSRGRVVTVSPESVVAEVTAQACSQSGLAQVFADLLDFEGSEAYFAAAPEVAGRSYGEARLAFETCSVIGLLTPVGDVRLNPLSHTVVDVADQLIVIATDDSAARFTGFQEIAVTTPTTKVTDDVRPLRALVVGWSRFGGRVLRELDEFLSPGSSIHVQVDSHLAAVPDLSKMKLRNAEVTAAGGRGGPEDLMILAEKPFDQVIVLAYRDSLAASDADARTLLSLLTVRMIWPVDAPEHVRVVAELLDQRHAVIAAPAGIDDLIISDALVSLMMAQLSERPQLLDLFDQLFQPEGPVVVMLPAEDVVPLVPLTFADVVAAAGLQGASAIGYRLQASGEVVLNPAKSARITLTAGDKLIAIGLRAPHAETGQAEEVHVGKLEGRLV